MDQQTIDTSRRITAFLIQASQGHYRPRNRVTTLPVNRDGPAVGETNHSTIAQLANLFIDYELETAELNERAGIDHDHKVVVGGISSNLEFLTSSFTREQYPDIKESHLLVSAYGSIFARADSVHASIAEFGPLWSDWARTLVNIYKGNSIIKPDTTSLKEYIAPPKGRFKVPPTDQRIAQLARLHTALLARQTCDNKCAEMCQELSPTMVQTLVHGSSCVVATFGFLMHMIWADLALPEKAEPASVGFEDGCIVGCLSAE